MPRKPRFFLENTPLHAVQRGLNKDAVFFQDLDYLEYLRCLKQEADEYSCAIHAYVLMTNHVHILLTPGRRDSLSRLFQGLGRHYVRYVNEKYQRSGGLWEGRYKANIIQSESYLLACMRYIELNPVKAGMVNHPAEYRWSSYAANALGERNVILVQASEYSALGSSSIARCAAYRSLFDSPEDTDEEALLRSAVQSGMPLGNAKFQSQIEAMTGHKIGALKRGRPQVVKGV